MSELVTSAVTLTGAAVFGAVAVPYTVSAIGFGTSGIKRRSFAARIQSRIGIVGAGSLFAFMQNVGTNPGMTAAAGGAAGATLGGVIRVLSVSLKAEDDGSWLNKFPWYKAESWGSWLSGLPWYKEGIPEQEKSEEL